ncbi:MAG: rhomboid family intramembrane serine protease [Verrucomicrobia bacterium]|nr:MAG: rhomboid family intramembrane serine protease [Verrucomicrobiota bacterium]
MGPEISLQNAQAPTPALLVRLLGRFGPIIAITAVCWVAFVFNNLIGNGHLSSHGIIPRRISGLPGILWAPFLHGSFRHLLANTVPLLVLGGILCARSKAEFWLVTIGGILLGGSLTWLLARTADHIGASGLIFCFFGYLASLAYFRRTFGTLLLSVICVLGYGGILRGLLPISAAISWESHVAGLIAGIALGWLAARASRTNGEVAKSPLPPDIAQRDKASRPRI